MANDDYLDPNVVPQTDNDIALNQTVHTNLTLLLIDV